MEIQSPETTCLQCCPRYDRRSYTSCSRTPRALWASVRGASWWCCRAWSVTRRAPPDGAAEIFTTLQSLFCSLIDDRHDLIPPCCSVALSVLYSLFALSRSTIGSCSPGLDYILAALDYTPLHLSLPSSFQTIFDLVSLHMWIILSLYATP